MTIYHAQTLLLFFLPVALGTAIEFSNCEIDIQYTGVVNITKVEIIPYPIKFHDNPIFKISGVTSQSITGRRTINVSFRSGSNVGVSRVSICDVTKCPIEPGPFVLTVPNLYAVKGNDHQSGEVKVTLSMYNPSEQHREMCAEFKFHASALAEFMNNPRPNGVNVSKVEIWPFNVTVNDNPIFSITAVTPKNISSSSTVSARMVLEGPELSPMDSRRGYKLCDSSSHCPIEPGRFVLTFPHPYWRYKITAGRYRVEVQIVNQNYPFQESMNIIFWLSVSEA